jgi:hypothetical protein
MEAVATTGLYPQPSRTQGGSEIDAKYGLMQLAVRAGSPATSGTPINRASYPQSDQQQQQLIYRGINNTRSTPYGQVMSYAGVTRPFETPVPKRDELGMEFIFVCQSNRLKFSQHCSSLVQSYYERRLNLRYHSLAYFPYSL